MLLLCYYCYTPLYLTLFVNFRGFVVDLDERRGSARVQIAEPAIVTDVTAEGRSLAEEVTMVLRAADPVGRTIAFDIVDDV